MSVAGAEGGLQPLGFHPQVTGGQFAHVAVSSGGLVDTVADTGDLLLRHGEERAQLQRPDQGRGCPEVLRGFVQLGDGCPEGFDEPAVLAGRLGVAQP
ncbi:hypothetical protein [Streptomyces sp. NPDC057582]|uniref:hypothetical protein n=1 Tax=Streptomyces sp. NPDC057582 TaxID=3346174 RepID=UPI00368CF85D